MIKDNDFKPTYIPSEHGYKNPLTKAHDCSDPFVVYCKEDKCYYGIHSGSTFLTMYRCKKISDMFGDCESKVIYSSNEADKTYDCLWAPELYFIDGSWYIYTSTFRPEIDWDPHRIVLKSKTANPFDGFVLATHLDPHIIGIDSTIYRTESGELYTCFAMSEVGGGYLNLAIQKMNSPTETATEPVIISKAKYDWELVPPFDKEPINEGPFFIKNKGRLFIAYSGNGTFCNDYLLGLLEFVGDNMLDPNAWEKCEVPFLTGGNESFSPGHSSFFYSPDDTELYACYHCLAEKAVDLRKPQDRFCFVQNVQFDKTGFPHLGKPLPKDVYYPSPSGE